MAAEGDGPAGDGPGADEEEDGGGDTLKLVATVVAKVPVLVIRIGWPVLMMKRRARKCSRRIRRHLEAGGMPPRMAAEMAEAYASEMSVRKLIQSLDIPSLRIRWDDDNP